MSSADYEEELESGMSDAQFKVFLMTVLEYIKKAESVDEVKRFLESLINELK